MVSTTGQVWILWSGMDIVVVVSQQPTDVTNGKRFPKFVDIDFVDHLNYASPLPASSDMPGSILKIHAHCVMCYWIRQVEFHKTHECYAMVTSLNNNCIFVNVDKNNHMFTFNTLLKKYKNIARRIVKNIQ